MNSSDRNQPAKGQRLDHAGIDSENGLVDAIESSIRKSFVPPIAPDLDPSCLPISDPPQTGSWQNVWKLAVCGLLVITGTYFLLVATGQGPFRTQPFAQTKLTTLYSETVFFGFEPEQAAQSVDQLSMLVSRRFRTSVALKQSTNTRFLGTIHLGGISRSTMTLMALVEEKPVLLFFERPSQKYDECIVCGNSHLYVFEKRLDDIIAFEVTPHSRPSLLSLVEDLP